MNITDKCAVFCYEQIAPLNEAHNVFVVQHSKTKNIFVKKTLTVYSTEVYRYLKNNRIEGIPEIIELAEDDGKLTVIEEYIGGQTLRSLLDEGRDFSESQTVDVITQLCRIVQRLHNSDPSIVHRDIKPSNIIIASDGTVKLIDMNAAKYFRSGKSQDTALIGTVGYAAPEQYGFGSSGVSTDIYSIGIVLNEMLTGKSPLEKTADGRFGDIVRKCTMMDPKDRYAAVEQLMIDLNPKAVSDERKTEFEKFRRYLLPGFRTGNPMHMAIAFVGYAVIITAAIFLNIQNAKSESAQTFEKLSCIFCGLATTFFTCNYLDVWSIVRIDRIKNDFLKAAAVVISDAAIIFCIIAAMVIIESELLV